MKTQRFFATLLAILCISTSNVCFGQLFENTVGALPGSECTWDGIFMPANRYIAVSASTTPAAPVPQVLVNQFGPTGLLTSSRYVGLSTNLTRTWEPRSIEHNNATTLANTRLYMTGKYKDPNQSTKVFFTRTSHVGAPQVSRTQNVAATGEEWGQAVERLANGDYVVLGNSYLPQTQHRFFAARFNLNLTIAPAWSFRYHNPGNLPNSYVINEACVGEVLDPQGLVTEVVAVTGRYFDPNQPGTFHTFAALLRASDGLELWRVNTPAVGVQNLNCDEGLDIVQDPTSRNFVVVGYVSNTSGARRMYVVGLSQVGAFLGASYWAIGGGVTNMAARDVTVLTSATGAATTFAAAGYVEMTDAQGLVIRRAFISTFTSPFAPVWTRWYSDTDPALTCDESIHRVGTAAAPGLYVTTNDQPSTAYDPHVLKTDIAGNNGSPASCPYYNINPDPVQCGQPNFPNKLQEPSTWKALSMNSTATQLTNNKCAQPQDDPTEVRDDETNEIGFENIAEMSARIYPTPAQASDFVNIEVLSPSKGSVKLEIFDISGKLVRTQEINAEQSELLFSLDAGTLKAGTYFAKISSAAGMVSQKLVIL